ncbi:MAG TPA: SRPBCC family protein [Williamwhitmania sp.]|nr:SRPBCC family protein [Williamwhitmania sp.]
MKIIKWLLFGIIGLAVLLLVMALFLPSNKHLEGKIVIKAPTRIIYPQIANFHNWEKWSPFQAADSTMVSEYSGQEMTKGASTSWKSKKNGNGSMTIVEVIPNAMINTKLIFADSSEAMSDWILKPLVDGTEVTWTTDIQHLSYPVGRLMGLIMKGLMRPMFDKGLASLKTLCESLPLHSKTSDVMQVTMPKQIAISIADSALPADMGKKMGEMFGQLQTFMKKNKFQFAGAPFGKYPEWNPEGINHFAVGIPVDRMVKPLGNIMVDSIPYMDALMVSHFGSYETIGDAHEKIGAYAESKGIEFNGPAWEEYITDPMTEPDTMKWETKIYYPIKK